MAINSPEGTRDLLPDEAKFWAHFRDTAFGIFARYGYQPIETPLFEQTDLFVRGIGQATDVVSKEMFTAISGENFKRVMEGGTIKAKSRLSLRPEGTAGVVRAVVQHDLVPQGAAPAKLMYAGPMFRAERPQKGRQRMFNQVGIECLGAEDPSVDAEGIIMLMRFYAAIGVPMDATRLLVNSMGCEQCRPKYREAVREYMNAHAENMCEECMRRAEINPLRAFDCKNPGCAEVMEGAPKISDYLCDDCREHYQAVKTYLDGAGISYIEDPTLVRGLDYYTAHRVRGAGRSAGIGQPKRHRRRRSLRQSWPRKWADAPRRASASRWATSAARWRIQAAGQAIPKRPAVVTSSWPVRVTISVRAEAFRLGAGVPATAGVTSRRWIISTAA